MRRNDIKMFHAEGRGYVKTKWEKRSWLWEETKEGLHVSYQSVMGEWEPGWRQSQSKGIIRGEDWRAEVVWMGLILKGWGTRGKHPGFHYSEGHGSSRWVLSRERLHCGYSMTGTLGKQDWGQWGCLECCCGPVEKWWWSEVRVSRELDRLAS